MERRRRSISECAVRRACRFSSTSVSSGGVGGDSAEAFAFAAAAVSLDARRGCVRVARVAPPAAVERGESAGEVMGVATSESSAAAAVAAAVAAAILLFLRRRLAAGPFAEAVAAVGEDEVEEAVEVEVPSRLGVTWMMVRLRWGGGGRRRGWSGGESASCSARRGELAANTPGVEVEAEVEAVAAVAAGSVSSAGGGSTSGSRMKLWEVMQGDAAAEEKGVCVSVCCCGGDPEGADLELFLDPVCERVLDFGAAGFSFVEGLVGATVAEDGGEGSGADVAAAGAGRTCESLSLCWSCCCWSCCCWGGASIVIVALGLMGTGSFRIEKKARRGHKVFLKTEERKRAKWRKKKKSAKARRAAEYLFALNIPSSSGWHAGICAAAIGTRL